MLEQNKSTKSSDNLWKQQPLSTLAILFYIVPSHRSITVKFSLQESACIRMFVKSFRHEEHYELEKANIAKE